ncbi:hypothetical protein V3481_012924 [Fusarium oxysporum f. sp. vasinfectum]
MDPIDLSSSRVNLNGPGDWKQWISIIHKFATAQNVWKYIDPSNAEKPALSKPEEPTVQQIRPTASDLTDLTAEEFRRLEFLHTQYRTKVQTHRDQQKALSSIQQHIVKTIGNYYSTIADEHDIAKELALLKARVQPTDWAHEQEVLERYYAVLKAPNRSKIDTWITSWQRILTEAQKLDLPDIKNLRPTRQFLQAVSSINPAFTDYWINKMEDEARNKPNWQDSFPDGIKISEIFERSHKAKRATGSKAVFSTFQNEGPNQSNNGYNDGDKGSNRRSKPSCLCGKKHYYSECYYLSKAARPNGWKPNKDIEHKINQKLEDPVLKEKVNRSLERYAGQRPQEPQAVQDHQNSADVRGTAFAGRHVTQEAQRSTFATSVYPLKDSFILDSGSDTHICNNKDRFVSYEPLTIEEVAYAGDSQLSILGYGQVHLRLEEGGIFILNEVAHIPAFHTNVASLDRMINKGYNWNPQTGAVTAKGKIVFHTKRINRQPVIEFNPVRPQQAPSAFSSSSEPRPEQVQEATRWHQRLGHLNPEALEQLVRHTTGARIKGPIRIDCRPCSEAKATRIISRRGPHAKAPRPFWRIYIDVFHLHESYNGKKTALLIKDEFTGMIFAYFHTEATQAALLGSLKSFESMIQRQYALGLCRIHRDNDPSLRTAYEDWIHQEGIQDEPTAPYTSAQNGPAERSGGVIATKARSMQLGANIPPELWPETWSAAVYLHNRSPQQSTGWKTPFQQLHQWLQSKNRDSGYESTSSQPDVTHLKAYGCRAYPMTGKALRNTQKKDLKTEAHAETGYLVGYDSSNIFRIWIPERSEVRRVRDVTFNEKVFFDPKDHPNNPNSVSTRRQQLQLELPQHIESDTDEEIDQIRSADETLPEIIVNTQGLQLTSSSDHTSQEPDEEPDQGHDAYDAYPSPQLTTSSAPPEPANQQLRSQRQRRPARKLLENEAQKKAGFHIYTRSFFQGREEKLHRRSLPPEPRNWKELQGHRFEPEFKEAANMEMGSHWSRGTFKPVPTDEAQGRPLPLTWVFKYKFNKHGFLTRFKARLCVRGDLQQPNDKETYAATLAGRTFRVLMAITAKFDLETRQLDAVNAFTNSLIDEDIYVLFPDGYSRRGWILKLIRALYGLRRSPLLWQKDLSNTFKQLGLELCPEDPCVFNNTWLTAFFFVDDIVFLYRSRHQQAADRLIAQLRAKYKMNDLGSLQWFLGIRVIRDRPNGKLWLCQDSYIEKLTTQFSIKKSNTFRGNPLSTNNLQQYELQATTNEISMFQQKIGGINYIAVITRPDVAKAASKLAEFLANPSPQHQTIADKVISYLYATRHLAIQFGGTSPSPTTGPIQVEHSSDLKIASDAAFADDQKTRKSSQGSIICLFGGPVSWKAGKQDTVTTSSTEAELLAFTHTAKESIAIQRLFKQLDLKLDHLPTIECDNQQTIRLISLETPRLKTALKHVDIHNCWARQAFKQGHFKIQYTPTALMLADGLTKPLPGQKFDQFVKQLGLIDISPLIEEAQVDSDLED